MSFSTLLITSCTLLSAMAAQSPATPAADTVPVSGAVTQAAVSGEEAAPILLAQAETDTPSADDLNAAALEAARKEEPAEAPYTAPLAPPPAQDVEAALTAEVTTGPQVFAGKTDEEVFSLAVDYLQNLKTMTADFIQTAPSGNVSTGALQLSRPGRLRFDYDDPNPTLIVATQGVVYLHDADLETTDSYPVRRTPLKFLLNRRIDSEDAQLLDVIRTDDSVSFTLASDDTETEGQLVMVFEAPELVLRRWAVFDARGGVTVVDLDNVIEGAKLANNAFRVPDAGGSFIRDR